MTIRKQHLIWGAWAISVLLILLGITGYPLRTWPLVDIVLYEAITILGVTLLIILIYKEGIP